MNGVHKIVFIRTTFVGFHRWKDAPEVVSFLRDWHRHIFHVKIGVEVLDSNREVEFFIFKKQVDGFIARAYADKHFESSCEMIAEDLLTHFQAAYCEVSEDGENGAIVVSRPIATRPDTQVFLNEGQVP